MSTEYNDGIERSSIRPLHEPIMSTTLILPGDDLPLNDPEEIRDRLEHELDLIIDGGPCGHQPTTVHHDEGSGEIGWVREGGLDRGLEELDVDARRWRFGQAVWFIHRCISDPVEGTAIGPIPTWSMRKR